MKYIQGDITNETSGLIIHGVNAQGVMGSGVARAIRDKWPQVYDAYKAHEQGRKALGQVQFVNISEGLVVGNCWTQEFYGNDGRVYADIKALAKCIFHAMLFCDEHNLVLKTPKIASGLAGLDWERDVVPIFENFSTLFPELEIQVFVV